MHCDLVYNSGSFSFVDAVVNAHLCKVRSHEGDVHRRTPIGVDGQRNALTLVDRRGEAEYEQIQNTFPLHKFSFDNTSLDGKFLILSGEIALRFISYGIRFVYYLIDLSPSRFCISLVLTTFRFHC